MTDVVDVAEAAARRRAVDEAATRQLAVNYALATDALGRGEQEYGRALYQRTFTPDAQIKAGSSPTCTGPDAWADYVTRALSASTATQHLIGTINVNFDPTPDGRARTGTMTTYLCASHERSPGGDISVVLGTYVDEVVSTDAGWRITRRTPAITSSELRKHG